VHDYEGFSCYSESELSGGEALHEVARFIEAYPGVGSQPLDMSEMISGRKGRNELIEKHLTDLHRHHWAHLPE